MEADTSPCRCHPVNDGGPAFPTLPVPPECPGSPEAWNRGMSLRDYFAAHALQSLLRESYPAIVGNPDREQRKAILQMIPSAAYEFADGMIREREKKP